MRYVIIYPPLVNIYLNISTVLYVITQLQVPRTMVEAELEPIFGEHGQIYELTVLRDKSSGNHKGITHPQHDQPNPNKFPLIN